MDYGINQCNAVPQPPQTRSESLSERFKVFMDADRALHQARDRRAQAEMELDTARQILRDAENYWSETSRMLAETLFAAAPEQTLKDIEATQKEMARCSPQPSTTCGTIGGGQLRQQYPSTTESRW